MDICYLDSNLLVCIKPVGVLAESHHGNGLPDLVQTHLVKIGESNCGVYTVHRLDRGVGGLTVLARSSDAAAKLSLQIQKGEFIKEYLAVLIGVPENKEDTLKDLLFRDASQGKTYVVDRMRKGVREASLSYQYLGSRMDGERTLSLVRIRLHTGRTHQIRVQFASRGLPLYGDSRYGSGDKSDNPALYAWHLQFRKPFQHHKTIDISVLPEAIYPFSLFNDELNELKNCAKTSEKACQSTQNML